MSLTFAELADVLLELDSVLPGATLDKIHEPEAGACQLKLRKHLLWIDLRPGLSRLHLIRERRAGSQAPPAWIMKLRKELIGLRLLGLAQIGDDRIVKLAFGRRERLERALLCELFGRSGRMLLLDADDHILASSLGAIERSEPYAPPTGGTPPQRSSRFPKADPANLSCNRAVEAHYRELSRQRDLERLRAELLVRLKAQHKRVSRRLAKLEADRDRTLVAEELRRQAEALKQHLGIVRRGQTRLSLADPMNPQGPEISVELDPTRGPVDNMNRMFSRARRLTAARGAIGQRLESCRQELAELESRLQACREAEDPVALEELRRELAIPGAVLVAGKRQARRLPFHSYVSAKGKRILVGRSGRDNHELTFHIARGSDLWLHARDAAGAHVVVRLGRDEEVDHETLLDAATLAAQHSPLKQDEKVDVSYTRVKNVRPIKGAAPGLVSVGQARTILVRMQRERILRLGKSKRGT